MLRTTHVITFFVLINVLHSTHATSDNFDGSILDNFNDAMEIISNDADALSFIPTYRENHGIGVERFLLSLFRKKQDEARTCGQLIKSRGFDYEIFYVTTQDGYNLTGYHIINPKFIGQPKPRPFLLLPGTFESCASFLVNHGDRQGSTAYYLTDRGEDVYFINFRGSTYSRTHTNSNPFLNPKYFDFDLEDIGTKDIPATVEYVKKVSGYDKIRVLAYSIATTEIFIQLSLDPSAAKNYELIFLAGPIGYFGQMKGIWGLFPHDPLTIGILSRLRIPIPPFAPFLKAGFISLLCTFTLMEPICLEIFNYDLGPDTYQMDISRLAVHASQVDTTSSKLFAHILQSMNYDHVRRFDHGKKMNLEKYGSVEPPIYNFDKLPTDKFVLLSGLGDYVATPENVQKLRNSFSVRPKIDHIITYSDWNHLDFLVAQQADRYYNDVILDIANNPTDPRIKQYDNVDSYSASQA